MVKINEAEELRNFLRSAATSIIYNDELHRQDAGIMGISYDLVMKREVRIKPDSIFIPYLLSFSFLHIAENCSDPKGRVTITFNMDKFKESNELQAYAKEHVKGMLAHAKKLDIQANNTRKRAEIVREAILNQTVSLLTV